MKISLNVLCMALCLIILAPALSQAGQIRTVSIKWDYPSPPPDLSAFRIYESGVMVKEVPVTDPSSPPLQVDFQMDVTKDELNFSMVAVAGTSESGPSESRLVIVPPLITSFTVTPPSLNNPGESADFAVVAEDIGGNPISYTIDFGDGTLPGSGSQQNHVFENAGTFTATATADNGKDITKKNLEMVVNDLRPEKPKILGTD